MAALAVVTAISNETKAALIAPGGGPDPTTGTGTYGINKVYDTGPQAYLGLSGLFHGLLDAQVWQEAGGTYDFVYQATNDANSADAVNRITFSNFTNFLTNVDDSATGAFGPGTVFPTSYDRSADGSTVGFNYTSPLTPGATSWVMVVDTSATAYSPTGGIASFSDGDVAVLLVPTPAVVPEPATAAIAAVGLVLSAIRPSRKRR